MLTTNLCNPSFFIDHVQWYKLAKTLKALMHFFWGGLETNFSKKKKTCLEGYPKKHILDESIERDEKGE